MKWIKATDDQPKWYQPVLCLLENRGEETCYPLMCHMNVHREWLDMYGNKISSTNLDYWYSVNDMIENVEDRFNEELAIALQSFGL